MDIKDLNKSQLILLAVLLSFITSIATGITTVTLMQQAPVSFTAPVNRVIQQTVQKIEQVEGKTVTQTIVVKEEDLVVDAIAKNQSAVFAITKMGQDANFQPAEVSAGRGFAVSTDGVVVTDASLVPDNETYFATNGSGKFKATFLSTDKAGFSFLKIGDPVNGTDKLSFTVPSMGDLAKMKMGQQVLVLGNTTISSLFQGLDTNGNIDLVVDKANAGGLVLDLDGEALGIALASSGSASFASIATINNSLSSLNPHVNISVVPVSTSASTQ